MHLSNPGAGVPVLLAGFRSRCICQIERCNRFAPGSGHNAGDRSASLI